MKIYSKLNPWGAVNSIARVDPDIKSSDTYTVYADKSDLNDLDGV